MLSFTRRGSATILSQCQNRTVVVLAQLHTRTSMTQLLVPKSVPHFGTMHQAGFLSSCLRKSVRTQTVGCAMATSYRSYGSAAIAYAEEEEAPSKPVSLHRSLVDDIVAKGRWKDARNLLTLCERMFAVSDIALPLRDQLLTEVLTIFSTEYKLDLSWNNSMILRWAAERDYVSVCSLCLRNPATTISKGTLQVACTKGFLRVVELLLRDNRLRERPSECLMAACRHGCAEVVRLLLEHNFDPTVDQNYCLRSSSEFGHSKVVQLLLSHPAVNPAAMNNAAIKFASQFGFADIVDLLLACPAVDPSVDDNYAVRWASAEGHKDVVRRLLQDKRVDPSDLRNSAIQLASLKGHYEIVSMLLADNRVDASVEDNYPLRKAREYGHQDIFRALVEWQAQQPPKEYSMN